MASSTSSVTPSLRTPLCSLLSIRNPILLAGMAHTSTAPLAAAVSAAGGLGTIGGLGYSPQQLRAMIHELKSLLPSPDLPFGVDLALPQVGAGARKTNHDYTKGQLDKLVEVIIDEKAKLFVSAIGVPPQRVVDRLHEGGVLVMNMVGKPSHAQKAFERGVDLVCAQGTEGGGHTGEIPTSILAPACVDVARRYRPKLLGGQEAMVVAAGGIWDGRGLAAALMYGAQAVWVGTRFIASVEAGSSDAHKQAVLSADHDSTLRTLVITGRPLRTMRNQYIDTWEKRPEEIRKLVEKGVVPMDMDGNEDVEVEFPYVMGCVAAMVGEIKPAKEIVEEVVRDAVKSLKIGRGFLEEQGGRKESKL